MVKKDCVGIEHALELPNIGSAFTNWRGVLSDVIVEQMVF